MRRSDREVTDILELTGILEECKVCRVALKDEIGLYIIPLNFGYTFKQNQLVLYFHSAKSGRKLSAIQKDDQVAFEMDGHHRLIEADQACGYGFAFASLLGTGTALIVSDLEEKKIGLSLLMKHQTGKAFTFSDAEVSTVTIWKIAVSEFTGKRHQGLSA
jgi:uncharacterized protein